MRRLLTTGLAVLLAFLALGFAPARGLEGAKLTIRAESGGKASGTFSPMPVADPSSSFVDDPVRCASLPFCTAVPLDVILPEGFDPDINEFFLTVKLSWDDAPIADGAAQGNDLDMYIYAIGKDEAGDPTYELAGEAASSSQPEVAKLFQPMNVRYVIVAYNFNGVNQGFKIDIDFVDATIVDPDAASVGPVPGSTDPASTGGTTSPSPFAADGSSSDAGRPAFSPSFVPSSPGSPSFLPAVDPTLTPVGDLPLPGTDEVFGDFGQLQDFQKDLAKEAPKSGIDLLAASRRQLGPPKEVGAPVLVFWLVGVPLALAAVAFTVLVRRRPTALTLPVPTTPAV